MQVIDSAPELYKAMQVKHAYYMSAPDGESHESVEEFISNWRDYDIDLNHIIRWDFHKQTDDDVEIVRDFGPVGSTYCEVVFVMPRKGYLFSNRINDVKAHETPRLLAFLQKHWEYMQSQWDPIPDLRYVPKFNPKSEFLEEVKRLTHHRTMTWFDPLVAAHDKSSEPGSPTRAMDRAAAVAIQQVVGDVLGLIDKGIPGVNGGYSLMPFKVDRTPALEERDIADIAGNLADWYFHAINN